MVVYGFLQARVLSNSRLSTLFIGRARGLADQQKMGAKGELTFLGLVQA